MQTAGSRFAIHRNPELIGLILVCCIIPYLLVLVYSAKSRVGSGPVDAPFQEVAGRLGKTAKHLNDKASLSLEQLKEKVEARPLLDLNAVESPQQIEPFLEEIFESESPDPATRRLAREDLQSVARKIFQFIEQENRALPSVGALSRVRLDQAEQERIRATIPASMSADSVLSPLQRAVKQHDDQRAENEDFKQWLQEKDVGTLKGLWRSQVQSRLRAVRQTLASVLRGQEKSGQPLLTFSQIQQLKPYFLVRRPAEFKNGLWLWGVVALLPFWIIHLIWRGRKFNGDSFILPVISFLCGLGLVLMAGGPDPLRDELRVKGFAWGIVWGAGALLLVTLLGTSKRLPRLIDWRRNQGLRSPLINFPRLGFSLRFSLSAAILLIGALFFFGRGPGESDALVNLGPFQPVEAIKILLVFFLASYFAGSWEYLYRLKNKLPGTQSRMARGIESLLRRWNIPKLNYAFPVMTAMAGMLMVFLIIGDLGPALVLMLTFVSLYAVARRRIGLAAFGLLGFLACAGASLFLEWPETFYKRLRIVWDPWENGLSGGDQIAHSLWALASGGFLGMGAGNGETARIPAGHTDLILSSLGEELGLLGVLTVLAMYLWLARRGFKTSLRATSDYEFFLGLGLTLLTLWQTFLIAAGILRIFPLSGVVTPFLSWGKSSMIANFAVFGFLLALSSQPASAQYRSPFQSPVGLLWRVMFGITLLLMGTAFCRQMIIAEETILQGALTRQADGSFIYRYNPRLTEVPDRYPNWTRGTIFDRGGKPLAISDCEQMRGFAEKLGYPAQEVRKVCSGRQDRYYPYDDLLTHQLGIRANLAAPDTNDVERDYASHLRGYDDHACRVARLVTKSQRELFREARAEDSEEQERPSSQWRSTCSDDAETDRLKQEWEHVATPDEKKLVFPVKRRLDALLPLLYHRDNSKHPAVQSLLNVERGLVLSLHIGLQQEVSEILKQEAKGKRAAVVVMEPRSGELLAWVSAPWPKRDIKDCRADDGSGQVRPECVDRALTAERPPGSTFKVVTAMAALRLKNGYALRTKSFDCETLDDGRVGKKVGGLTVHDHEHVTSGHGAIQMKQALIDSCNAYFAQLGYESVQAENLKSVTDQFEIQLFKQGFGWRKAASELIQGSFGQEQTLATPFEMARVAATVANDGEMPAGRWVLDAPNKRPQTPERIIDADAARFLAEAMRGVVTEGTAQGAMRGFEIPTAGKTGTAENRDCEQFRSGGRLVFRNQAGRIVYREIGDKSPTTGLIRVKNCVSHAWFIGFAPYDGERQIALAVLIENAGGGGAVAAPIARSVITAARRQGLIP